MPNAVRLSRQLNNRRTKLMNLRMRNAAILGLTVLGSISLSGCATEKYVDEQIATVNGRIDTVEGHVRQVEQSAQQANTLAQQANATAEAAAASAQRANQGVDQLNGRVSALEQSRAKKRPRN
jgi:murein lipoprotein